MKCPHCKNRESFKNDTEDPELETCTVCSGEFYPIESIEKYGEKEAYKGNEKNHGARVKNVVG